MRCSPIPAVEMMYLRSQSTFCVIHTMNGLMPCLRTGSKVRGEKEREREIDMVRKKVVDISTVNTHGSVVIACGCVVHDCSHPRKLR